MRSWRKALTLFFHNLIFKVLKNLRPFNGRLLFAGSNLLEKLYFGFIEAADLLIDELEGAVDQTVNDHRAI